MALTSGTTTTKGLACDGATQTFNSTFKIYDDDDVQVFKVLTADGTETQLTKVAATATPGLDEYNVSGVGNSTFSITTGSTYAATYTITMRRNLSLLQSRRFTNQRGYRGETHELAYDELTMMMQQLDEVISRCIRFPLSTSFSEVEIPTLTGQDGKFLRVTSAETGVEWATPASFTASLPLTVANGGTGATTAAQAKINLGISAFQHKTDATVAPTATDDSSAGYEVGSRWVNVTADRHYICVDATATAAVWIETIQLSQDLAWTGDHTLTGRWYWTEQTDSSSSGSVTFDFEDGQTVKITLSEDISGVTLSNVLAGMTIQIRIIQDSTARTISGWPAAVKWAGGGIAPTISTTSGAVDIVTMFYDGTNYWASVVQDYQ